MKKTSSLIKGITFAIGVFCTFMSMSILASENVKSLLDLLLKKGVITQQEYDDHIKTAIDSSENRQFKDSRIAEDLTKLNKRVPLDAGNVLKNGLGVQSGDGKYKAQFIGRVHFDYRNFSESPSSAEEVNENKFDLRRARFGVKGQLGKGIKYKLFGDFGNSSAKIDEGYIDWSGKKGNKTKIRMGKFKMPFSLEQLTSSNNIDFMERSLVGVQEGQFIPTKEFGIQVYGNPMPGSVYALALSNGTKGGTKDEEYDSPDIIFRGAANLSALGKKKNKGKVMHVGFGYSVGEQGAIGSFKNKTEARSSIRPFKSTTFGAGTDRTRMNLELAFANGPVKIQGEYFTFEFDDPSRSSKLETTGYYVQAVYNLTGEDHNYSQKKSTFGGIKPKVSYTTKSGRGGAWQLAVRLSKIDGEEMSSGSQTGAKATTLGLNWKATKNARVLLNFISTDFDQAIDGVTSERAVNLRGQINF
tara:strand:- start:979 stop:2391 length:1413 start_codon:yes stop_codon:yes gene_type:complete